MSPDGGKLHQIGEVAVRVGLSLRTVRYYEEMGLIAPAQRTEGGFRLYSDADIERLQLIKHMKPLGLSVQNMVELMEARDALQAGAGDDDALETLTRFSGEAGDRVEHLREQLDRAEQFANQLSRDLRRHRRRLRQR